jgi:hypothetical protein
MKLINSPLGLVPIFILTWDRWLAAWGINKQLIYNVIGDSDSGLWAKRSVLMPSGILHLQSKWKNRGTSSYCRRLYPDRLYKDSSLSLSNSEEIAIRQRRTRNNRRHNIADKVYPLYF